MSLWIVPKSTVKSINNNKNKLNSKINWFFNLKPNTSLKKKKSKLVNMLFMDAFTSAWEDEKNGFD